MELKELHQRFLESSGVSTDTRAITQDCIFFALRGANFNGNEFAHEALKKGARYVVIDDLKFHLNTGQTILCKDVLTRLQQLATYHRNQLGLPIVSITGSNGKTTSKELIHAVLAQKFDTFATRGNYNNHIGVPLTLLSMTNNTQIGVVEMGANNHGEIDALCQIALPDYGYITNFGKAHIEGFGSLEGVVKAKSEMYRHLAKTNKTVFVNGNDQKQLDLTASMDRITFGKDGTDYPISLLEVDPFVKVRYKDALIKSQLIGTYNFHNIAASIAIGQHFGVSEAQIKTAIEAYVPSMNRSEIVRKNGKEITLDAYNANPTSMQAALEHFLKVNKGQGAVILGDMFELGETAAAEHQAIADLLAKETSMEVYLVGQNFYGVEQSAAHMSTYPSFEGLSEQLRKQPINAEKILIKGSRGMALERCLELL